VWGGLGDPIVSDTAVGTWVDQSTFASPPAPAPAATYWYYCTNPAGYFPYVQNCNKAWIPVVPQSAPPPPGN
jgi:hypothetical protein